MNRISKSVASLLIAGGAAGAWFGGHAFFRDAAFAQQQRDVETNRQQLSTANDLMVAFRNVGKVVEPSVVNINVRKTVKNTGNRLPDDMLRRFFRDNAPQQDPGDEAAPGDDNAPDDSLEQVGTGSGVIMEVDGKTAYILTNNHVAGGASEMVVTLSDGRQIEGAKLVGADPKTDLAVVKISADHLIPAKWGDSTQLQKGDWILAFGSPFGYVGSMTHGIVSALDRTIGILGSTGYEDFIQVDAPINPGNSGGPLVNLHGEVVGINTAIASRSGGFQGIGFAIPSNEAKFVYGELKGHGKVTRGWLGVSIRDVSLQLPKAKYFNYKDTSGVFVEDEVADSPAIGKLKNDDIITEVNGNKVQNSLELRNRIAALTPGSDVKLTVFRDGKTQTVDVKLAEQPEDLASAASRSGNRARGNARGGAVAGSESLGMRLIDPNDRVLQRFNLGQNVNGAVVMSVQPRSEAEKALIRPGDVITEVDHKAVDSAKSAQELIAKRDTKRGALLRITSPDGTSRSVLIGGSSDSE
ncbi:MAG TPA: trypsin-like peptidase domain-containing protein [Humisphaera sp.]|jgi:serine protease Do|nr:trypsin-like peptidase domain-containing protein [Humisphaera sp.]